MADSEAKSQPEQPENHAFLQAGFHLSDTYRLERILGKGGMGEVWLATHLMLNEPRAIKFMLDSAALNPVSYTRFVQGEAKVMMRLNHPNVVRVYELSRYSGIPYIVMEYVPSGKDGVDLRDLLKKRGRLSTIQVNEILDQLAAALTLAHQNNLVHRDIKPANVLLTGEGKVKLGDFGIAKDLDDDINLTRSGQGIGTPVYLAPEQARGKAAFHSDQYSLGVLLYELLAGRPPFIGDYPTLLMQHAFSNPPSLRQYSGTIHPEIEAVVLRALAKKPEDRYSSVAELANAFRQALARVTGGFVGEATNPEMTTAVSVSDSPTTALPFGVMPTAPTPISVAETTPIGFTVPKITWEAKVSAGIPNLVGREQELNYICRTLLQEDARLVTLTGAGGTGKTRLSEGIAEVMAEEFQDGVFFVKLEAVDDAGQVARTLIQALKIKEQGAQPPLETLVNHLKDKKSLLIIDNFEQVIQASKVIAQLIKETEFLKVLITSRTALRVSMEQVYPVLPLAVPDYNTTNLTAQALGEFAAVDLFVQAARRVDPNFNLTDDFAAPIAEICRRLDGLPLAIELAAARIESLSPPEILERLSLKLLSGGAEDRSERQRTLRKAIDWSFDLLDEEQQFLFMRLGVFRGGCRLKTAESVCDPDGEMENDMLDGVSALVAKSLLRKLDDSTGTRYVMLHTIREYALDKLKKSGDFSTLQKRSITYFLKESEQQITKMGSPEQEVALKLLDAENDNLRAVLNWTLEKEETETALRFCGALGQFWLIRGWWSEGREFLDKAFALEGEAKLAIKAKALNVASALAKSQGDFVRSRELLEQCLVIYPSAGDKEGTAKVLNNLALLDISRGDYATAKINLQECLNLSQELNNKPLVANAQSTLGTVHDREGDFGTAQNYYEQALETYKQLGNRLNVANLLNNLGINALRQGNLDAAESYYSQALEIARQTGNRNALGTYLVTLADVYLRKEKHQQAEQILFEVYDLCRQTDNKPHLVLVTSEFARLALAYANWEKATTLFGFSESLRREIALSLSPEVLQVREEALILIRDNLSEVDFSAYRRKGELMTRAELNDYLKVFN